MKYKKRKKDRKPPWTFLASLLVFAAGAGIFLYPAVSNYLAERGFDNVIRTYNAAVEAADPQKMEEAWKEAEIYNENLAGDPVHDPFVMGSGYVLPDNYMDVLNLNGDGVMGYIEIPKIEVNLPVYHGTSEEVLEQGAGHMDVTALPIGGKNRHSVISAHRGLPRAELFTRLDELEEGDMFYLHVLDKTLAYQVDQISVIEPEELSFLTAEEDKDLVTLLTCTPYAVNTHRLLVRGTRVPYEEKETEAVTEQKAERTWVKAYFAAALAGLVILAVIIFIWKRRNRKYKNRKYRNRRRRKR